MNAKEVEPPFPGSDGTQSERQVRDALVRQLLPGEVLMSAIRLTDARDGDVEADFIVLFPDCGAAVIEVKGGDVRYADGQWTTANKKYTRRIHPVEQARRAKHALRRYLDRQPEWGRPLLRCEWFVALPATDVTGDMGPEGSRERMIGANDLGRMRAMVRAPLESTLNPDPMPSPGWVDDVVTLLLRADRGVVDESRRPVPRKRFAFVIAAVAGVALAAGGWLWARHETGPAAPAVPVVSSTSAADCAPGYSPCLPVVDDLNCPDIRTPVEVTGDDPYALDRDGDGEACETYQ